MIRCVVIFIVLVAFPARVTSICHRYIRNTTILNPNSKQTFETLDQNLATSFSLTTQFWIRYEINSDTTHTNDVIFRISNHTELLLNPAIGMLLYRSSYVETNNSMAASPLLTHPYQLRTKTWHFIVLEISEQLVRMRIDGFSAATHTRSSSNSLIPSSPISFENNDNNGNVSISGFRMYNESISFSEVTLTAHCFAWKDARLLMWSDGSATNPSLFIIRNQGDVRGYAGAIIGVLRTIVCNSSTGSCAGVIKTYPQPWNLFGSDVVAGPV
eukprot:PhF_6_TR21074/c0_g1_i3/m.30367